MATSGGVVTLSERSYPIGSAEITIHNPPAAVATALASPLSKTALRIFAGYDRPGLAAFDAPIFHGVLQSATLVLEGNDTAATSTAATLSYATRWATFDALLDSIVYTEPDWTPPSPDLYTSFTDPTYTPKSLTQHFLPVKFTLSLGGYAMLADPDLPSRVLKTGDRILDYLVLVASALKPDANTMLLWVDQATTPDGWSVPFTLRHRSEFTSTAYWSPVWSRCEQQADLSEAATALRLSVTSGDTSANGVSYPDAPFQLGVTPLGAAKIGTRDWPDATPRQHLGAAEFQASPGDLTPAGGVNMYSQMATRAITAARARDRRWLITTRAAWWLKPRDPVRITTLPGVTVDGVASEYRVDLDTGLMTTTVRTT